MRAPVYLLVIVGIFVLSFLYLYQHSVTLQLMLALNEKQGELSRVEEEVERLRASTSQLLSYPRIKHIASGWGFRYPHVNDIVIIQETDSLAIERQ